MRLTPSARRLAQLAVAGTVLLAVTASPALATAPTSSPAPTDLSGYLFDDEFNDTTVDPSAWGILDRGGDADNAENQCYKPGNVAEKGGFLEITSKVDSSCPGYAYTSGMVQWKKFNFTSGTIEIRAKQSGGKGSWPSQWLLGSDCQAANLTTSQNSYGCNWPNPGSDEIDIAEFKTSGPTSVWQNVVSGDSGFKTCRPDVSASDNNFHVYSLTWHARALVWKVDGRTTCTQTDVVPSQAMFLIMNNAMGGGGGGEINPADFPQTMLVDYVRVTKI